MILQLLPAEDLALWAAGRFSAQVYTNLLFSIDLCCCKIKRLQLNYWFCVNGRMNFSSALTVQRKEKERGLSSSKNSFKMPRRAVRLGKDFRLPLPLPMLWCYVQPQVTDWYCPHSKYQGLCTHSGCYTLDDSDVILSTISPPCWRYTMLRECIVINACKLLCVEW